MPYLIETWDTDEVFVIENCTLCPVDVEDFKVTDIGLVQLDELHNNSEKLTCATFESLFAVEYRPRIVFERKAHLLNRAIWSLPAECADFDARDIDASDKLDHGYICPHLCIKPATSEHGHEIGNGVFATTDIATGEFIGEYTGIVRFSAAVSFDSYACVYPNCQDAMHISAKEYGNIIRFINHSSEPNATFKTVYHEGLLHIVCMTTRDIHPGEQLFVDYGASYWQEHPPT